MAAGTCWPEIGAHKMKISDLRSLLACGVATIALMGVTKAFAQETTNLQEVVVEGEGQGTIAGAAVGPVNGVVAKKTLTGAKTATDITEIPQSVSVIGREEIDDQGAQKADEALRYTAGVFAQPFGADSDTNWIFIRGFQATATGVYLDGLQTFSQGFGGFYVDTFGLERIEVLKGPASVLYGGSNPGGLVNYVSKRPTFERERYVETGVNDAGNVYLGFDIGDVTNSQAANWRVVGRVAGGDTYSDNQDGWRGFISPSVTWQPDEQTRLTILANYTHIDENHGGGSFLPYFGTVTDYITPGGVNLGRIDPDFNYSEPSIDLYDRQQGSIGYELEHTFDSDWTVRSNARFAGADIQEVAVYPNGWSFSDPTKLARINFDHDTQVTTFLMDNQVEGKVETGAVEHTLLAGFDYKRYNIDQVQSSGLFDPTNDNPIDPFDPVYGQPLTPRVSYLNQDLTQQQIGLYAQDQLRFGGGWLVTLNGRYDWVKTEADNRPNFYNSDPADFDDTQGQFSGRAGLAYEFENGVTPYFSASTFFNPLIETNAVTGELFEPEEGEQYEVGVKYTPTFIDGLFTLSVFDLTRRNVLTAAAPTPDNPFPSNEQTGEVRSRGVELEGKVNITEDWKVTAALTAYELKVTKDANPALVGKQPFLVPEVMASIWTDYTFRGDAWYDGVSVGGGVRYVGSSYADKENTLKVPDVTLLDLKLGYTKDNWGVDFNVTNVFDKEYVSGCQGVNVCSYGEGRSFKLKAHATW
jgi:iron complex outermembrane receptor protein